LGQSLIFGTESHFYAWASLDSDLPVHASYGAGMKSACHHTQLFIGWDGVSLIVRRGYPWTTVFHIFTSQVARITGMSLCTQSYFIFNW
jgi:hypothetical protein